MGRRALEAARVAFAALMAAGLVACDPSPPPAPTSSIPAASRPTPTALDPTASAPLPTLGSTTRFGSWSEVRMPIAVPGIFGGNAPEDVTTFRGSLVAVGGVNGGCCDASFSTDTRALVWTSTDGASWRLAPDTDAFDLGHMRAVVAGLGTVVAVGTRNEDSEVEPGSIDYRPTIWLSPDGRRWTAVAGAPELVDVAFADGQFLGVANEAEGPSIWTSESGRGWSVVATPGSLGPGVGDHLVTTSKGAFLIGRDDADLPQPRLWWSPDGVAWAVVGSPTLEGAEVQDVARIAGRFVAVGRLIDPVDGGDRAFVATSMDGQAWERLPATAFPQIGFVPERAISLADELLILGEEVDSAGELSTGAAWLTADGLHWQGVVPAADLPATLDLGGPVAFGDVLVAVGRGHGPPGETFGPVAWLIH